MATPESADRWAQRIEAAALTDSRVLTEIRAAVRSDGSLTEAERRELAALCDLYLEDMRRAGLTGEAA